MINCPLIISVSVASSLPVPGSQSLLLFEAGRCAQLLLVAKSVPSIFGIVEQVGLNFADEVVQGAARVVEIHLNQELATAIVHFGSLTRFVQAQLGDNIFGAVLGKLQVELGIRDVVFLEPLLDLFFFVVGLEHLVKEQIAMLLEHPVGWRILTPCLQ